MKRNKIFIALVSVVMLMCMLCGCSAKTAIDAETFTKTMEAENYTVTDVTSDTETNGLATSVLIAANDNYQIEFYVLTDNDTGESVFYNNQNLFDDEHPTKTMSSEVSSGNYNYYAFNADGNFHMIARVDNTMLWCEADKAYKEEIVDLVKKLGYK